MNRLAILGASGHGKVVADLAEEAGWTEVVFFDDRWPELTAVGAWSVKGNTQDLLKSLSLMDGVIVAIGANKIRMEKYRQLHQQGAALVCLIHPSAVISRYSHIGCGSVVMAGAVVNVDARIGDACIVNTSATIDHDCVLEDAVHISPGAHLAGDVRVQECSWIGIGANVRQQIVIGRDVIVGAGAVVVENLPDKCVAFGIPAKPSGHI
jgi:sugar O-acyltransferase (sialic acid O-acetyltransferase NeuD family)